jgi:stage III sporulation protein AD
MNMNIIGIAGIAILTAIIAVMLKRYNTEYAVVLSIAAGLFILFAVFANIMPAVKEINTFLKSAGLSSKYTGILLKTLGICFLTQFAADSCRDAGEDALASKTEIAGKVFIVIISLPLFEEIAKTATELIGGKG